MDCIHSGMEPAATQPQAPGPLAVSPLDVWAFAADAAAAEGKPEKPTGSLTYHIGDGPIPITLDFSRLQFEIESLNGLLHSIRLVLTTAAVPVEEAGPADSGPAPLASGFLVAYV